MGTRTRIRHSEPLAFLRVVIRSASAREAFVCSCCGRVSTFQSMKTLLTLSLLLLTACSNSTGPKGHDPTAIVRNNQNRDPVIWSWFDGHATSGVDTIPAGTIRCERFT